MRIDKSAQPVLLTMTFAVVCVVSALALIYTKHEARKLFVQLEQLTAERDELNIEWGQPANRTEHLGHARAH